MTAGRLSERLVRLERSHNADSVGIVFRSRGNAQTAEEIWAQQRPDEPLPRRLMLVQWQERQT